MEEILDEEGRLSSRICAGPRESDAQVGFGRGGEVMLGGSDERFFGHMMWEHVLRRPLFLWSFADPQGPPSRRGRSQNAMGRSVPE